MPLATSCRRSASRYRKVFDAAARSCSMFSAASCKRWIVAPQFVGDLVPRGSDSLSSSRAVARLLQRTLTSLWRARIVGWCEHTRNAQRRVEIRLRFSLCAAASSRKMRR